MDCPGGPIKYSWERRRDHLMDKVPLCFKPRDWINSRLKLTFVSQSLPLFRPGGRDKEESVGLNYLLFLSSPPNSLQFPL
jgi:hypothetical protein